MALHTDGGIMLTFARTDTKWFQSHVFPHASGLLFLAGRLKFYRPDGELIRTGNGSIASAGAPSVLASYDPVGSVVNSVRLRMARDRGDLRGFFVDLSASRRS